MNNDELDAKRWRALITSGTISVEYFRRIDGSIQSLCADFIARTPDGPAVFDLRAREALTEYADQLIESGKL